MSHPTAFRKIFFYRIHSGRDEQTGQPLPMFIDPIIAAIHKIPLADPRRALPGSDGSSVCAFIDQPASPQKLKLATVRMNGLPQTYRAGGKLSPLALATAEGLAEATHMMCFPGNIIGAVQNFYGPRATRLSAYIEHCLRPKWQVYVEPLLRRDVTAKLQRMSRITLLDLKLRRSHAELLRQADQSLADAFEAAAASGDVEHVEIVLRAQGRKGHLGARLARVINKLAGRPEFRETAEKLAVKGESMDSGRVEWLDLLQDRLVSGKDIVLQDPRSRALDDSSAYSAIERSFQESKVELQSAAGVSV